MKQQGQDFFLVYPHDRKSHLQMAVVFDRISRAGARVHGTCKDVCLVEGRIRRVTRALGVLADVHAAGTLAEIDDIERLRPEFAPLLRGLRERLKASLPDRPAHQTLKAG